MTRRRRMVALAIVGLSVALWVPRAAATEDDASGPQATLTWTSKDDDGLYGYLVYRASKREGPYRRVNAEIVHVVPADAAGLSHYGFVDRNVVPGRTYFYYLDTVDANGRKRRFSGVVSKTVAKR